MSEKTIETKLTEAKELAQNENRNIQKVGRTLTEAEIKRSDALSNCVAHIQVALEALANGEN